MLPLMSYQSARDSSADGLKLASANFELSLDHHCQLDKMEEKAFEMFSHHIDDHKIFYEFLYVLVDVAAECSDLCIQVCLLNNTQVCLHL